MPFTLEEIKEELKKVNEVDLLEILGITAEDLVHRFGDIIEDKIEQLEAEFEDPFGEEEEQ